MIISLFNNFIHMFIDCGVSGFNGSLFIGDYCVISIDTAYFYLIALYLIAWRLKRNAEY